MSGADELPFVVKICGITGQRDARIALDAGANALGFNFYAGSPRYITPDRARSIIRSLEAAFLKVGVFVNPTQAELVTVVDQTGMDIVQLHGDRCPAQLPSSFRVWRSVIAGGASTSPYLRVEAYVIDSPSSQFGGSGKSFDWSLAAAFPHRKIIAGGLDATNVAEAIRVALPWGVDACSRLESTPGKKDEKRVRNFIREAFAAHAENVSAL